MKSERENDENIFINWETLRGGKLALIISLKLNFLELKTFILKNLVVKLFY